MYNFRRKQLAVAAVLLAIAALVALPVIAQDAPPEPGQGGIIIEGTFGSDPVPFNPLVCQEATCFQLAGFMLPGLIAVDPETATFAESGPNAMVTGWTISDDGLVYTFSLRQDKFWSDGTPVTAKDFVYSFDAIASGQLQNTLYGSILETVASMTAPDDYTLVATIKAPDCRALAQISIPPVPSHILPADFAALNDAEWNLNPTVTAGAFRFGEFRPSELVTLLADQNYKDGEFGYVAPEGYILKNVPDQTVNVEQFLAGETNFIQAPQVGRRADVRALAAEGKVQVFSYAGDFYDYFMFNLADPKNPQNGRDADGNLIPQGYHPIFSVKEVRQALAKAVDIDAIIKAAAFGEGTRMTSYLMANSWAYHQDLPPIAYDPEAAKAMLDAVGWRDEDGDGVRESHGVTLPDGTVLPDGTPMRFTMIGNEGNTRRAAEGQLIQDQLKQIGVDAIYQAVEFATWQELVNAQTFDVAMLAWQVGYPDDPDATQLFYASSDVVGSGNNAGSFYNARFEALNDQARTLPGCDPEARAAIYREMQEIMQDELPYLWMYSISGMYAASASVQNWKPYAQQPYFNIDAWYLK